jgi:hypothetical protein
MDSPGFNTFENIAGRGVGLLAALTTIKSGGLGSYLMNRQRMMGDPSFRASLAGSPFAAGVFGVGGETGPAPAAPGQLPAPAGTAPVAQPGPYASGYVFPSAPGQQVAQPGTLPEPTAQNVPGYLPGEARTWMPHLTPYDPKVALEQRGLATTELGLGLPEAGQRAQYKMAGGIPLNQEEQDAAVARARHLQELGGQGTVVKLDIPGMTTNVGSPYNFSAVTAEEYPTYALAAAAAAAKNASIPPGNPQWTVAQSGRGTWLLSQPATQAQTAPPATPPAVQGGAPRAATPPAVQGTAPRAAAPPQQPAAPPTQPGPYAGGYVMPATPPVQATPSQPAAPAAAPPPPPPSPPAAPPPPSSAFDRDAIVPHVVVPEGQTGFPSAAFVDQGAAPAPPPAPAPPANANVPIYPAPQGFVFHHSGGTTLQGLRATLQDRGLGSEYLMDRDGTIYAYGAAGSPHMQPNDRWGGIAPGLSNKNALGMELVARNNQDVTPAQVAAARNFIATNYPNTPVYGHGEVNPGHKQADEGMAVVNAIRTDRAAPVQVAAATPPAAETVAFPSPAFVDTGGAGAQPGIPTVAQPPVVQPSMPPALPPPRPAGGESTVLTGPASYPPGQQMPMTGETRRTAEGEQTYHAPDASNADVRANLRWNKVTNIDEATPQQIWGIWQTQRYLDRQKALDKADIDRTQKAALEDNGAGLQALGLTRDNITKFVTDFPDAATRSHYLGLLRHGGQALKQIMASDPDVARFNSDLALLGVPVEGGSWIGEKLGLPSGSVLMPGERNSLKSVLPSAWQDPATFEQNLQNYRDEVDSQIAMRDFLTHRTIGSTTTKELDTFLTNLNDERRQRRLDSFRTTQPPSTPPATTPPTTTPPNTTPPATMPPQGSQPWAPTATWTIQ